jgi:hypothetical protein
MSRSALAKRLASELKRTITVRKIKREALLGAARALDEHPSSGVLVSTMVVRSGKLRTTVKFFIRRSQ